MGDVGDVGDEAELIEESDARLSAPSLGPSGIMAMGLSPKIL